MAEATRTLVAKQSFVATVNHDGANTTLYRLSLDGKTAQEVPVSSRDGATGNVTFAPATFDVAGDHKLTVAAINEVGIASLDVPFKVVEQAGALPSKPTVAIVIQLVVV